MTIVLCGLAYFVAAIVLLVVAILGFVTTDKKDWKMLGIALACFALSPLIICFAGFTVPVLIALSAGYGIVVVGMLIRKKIGQVKDRIFEEIVRNIRENEQKD